MLGSCHSHLGVIPWKAKGTIVFHRRKFEKGSLPKGAEDVHPIALPLGSKG